MQAACALLEICCYGLSCYHVRQDKLDPIAHAGRVADLLTSAPQANIHTYTHLHICITPHTHSLHIAGSSVLPCVYIYTVAYRVHFNACIIHRSATVRNVLLT